MKETTSAALLMKLRREHGWTQQMLAEKLHVSDRTISKWECGKGLPDITLLKELSSLYQIPLEHLLTGELFEQQRYAGDMRHTKFYVCPNCGHMMFSTGDIETICCGRKQMAEPITESMDHEVKGSVIDGEIYISMTHEMSKHHYISFAALVHMDRVHVIKLYPQQMMELRFPFTRKGDLFVFCNQHGLMKYAITDIMQLEP